MKSSGKHLLVGEILVDEFYVGGAEEEIIGRSTKGKKKIVIAALEISKVV